MQSNERLGAGGIRPLSERTTEHTRIRYRNDELAMVFDTKQEQRIKAFGERVYRDAYLHAMADIQVLVEEMVPSSGRRALGPLLERLKRWK